MILCHRAHAHSVYFAAVQLGGFNISPLALRVGSVAVVWGQYIDSGWPQLCFEEVERKVVHCLWWKLGLKNAFTSSRNTAFPDLRGFTLVRISFCHILAGCYHGTW